MSFNKRLFTPEDSATSYAGYTSDLKLHYHAGDATSAPSGSTFVDISGASGLNGSLQGNASFNSGGYVTFDGVNDYINIPHNTINTINDSGTTRALTISMWIYWNGTNNYAWILGKGGQSTDWEYDSFVDFRSASVGFMGTAYYNGANSMRADGRSSSNTVSSSTWYMLTVGYDNTNDIVKVWQNGTLKATDTSANYPATPSSTNSLHIGQRPDLSYDWKGRISQVRIYEGIISQSTVNELYAAGYQG